MFARVRYADGAQETSRLPAAAASSAATGITGGGSGPSGRPWTSTASSGSPPPHGSPVAPALRVASPSATLVRRWQELLPPGPGPSRGEWRSTPSTPTTSQAQGGRNSVTGGRDLGAVLVQRGRDVHPRALQDRLRGRGLAWTISLAPALYSFFGDDGILPGHPEVDAGAWGLLQLDSGPPPSRPSTCFCWSARYASCSASRHASRRSSSSSAWSRSRAGIPGC